MMTVRYPSGEVTPHGWHHIAHGTRPMMGLRAWDGSIEFDLLGGLAPPFNDPTIPEAVALKSLKGLIAPWKHIVQKGATQDGVTHVDALLEPTEVEATVECIGRDGTHTQRVVRDLIASIDAIKQSELWWLTHDLGYWWADIRWLKGAPPDALKLAPQSRQQLSLRLQADTGLWKTYDDVATFRFGYDSMTEDFDFTDANDAGTNWPVHFYEQGVGAAGFPFVDGSALAWSESGLTERGVVIGPRKDFATDTDNQVIEIQLGSIPEITFQGGAFDDAWGRMGRNPDGTWDGNGIRARVGLQGVLGWVELAKFKSFTKTVLFQRIMIIPPLLKGKFSLVCGDEDNPRLFRILRSGITILTHKETGANLSMLGPNYRGVGCGLKAGAGTSSQKSPAWITRITAGDNTTISQSGFLKCHNVGDQKLYYDFTLFGPGVFQIWDGPGSDEFIEFGPLLPGQVAFLRTDPRSNTTLVENLTETPSTPQQASVFQQALKAFESFAFINNVAALLSSVSSVFGTKTPQGSLYRFLKGRFSENVAIPPKSPGNPVSPYYIKVAIDDGNADSKIIAAGTPTRRYPV